MPAVGMLEDSSGARLATADSGSANLTTWSSGSDAAIDSASLVMDDGSTMSGSLVACYCSGM